jgi:hypothetical protein
VDTPQFCVPLDDIEGFVRLYIPHSPKAMWWLMFSMEPFGSDDAPADHLIVGKGREPFCVAIPPPRRAAWRGYRYWWIGIEVNEPPVGRYAFAVVDPAGEHHWAVAVQIGVFSGGSDGVALWHAAVEDGAGKPSLLGLPADPDDATWASARGAWRLLNTFTRPVRGNPPGPRSPEVRRWVERANEVGAKAARRERVEQAGLDQAERIEAGRWFDSVVKPHLNQRN